MLKIKKNNFSDDQDLRNFLFFLSDAHPIRIEDPLIGALACPSSWEALAAIITKARKEDVFARSIERFVLYVHVPFCDCLCNYCHCSRVLLRQRSEIDGYLKGLQRQMMLLAPVFKGMYSDSICFGGGTPSILDEKQMASILDWADAAFPSSERKILLEVHPASWTPSKLAMLSERGLYRLSVGVQSFDDKVLRRVSRFQDKKHVLWCLRSAKKAKIPFVNVDIIAGLPGQTVQGLKEDIHHVVDEGITLVHLQPYVTLSWKELRATGESVGDFLKRRDALMKAGADVLGKAGFSCQGMGGYVYRHQEFERKKILYHFVKTAIAGFGPFAKGEFPGVGVYASSGPREGVDFSTVKVSAEDFDYVMSKYAVFSAIGGLDEKFFFKQFGVDLNEHYGEGLKYLQKQGLLACTEGEWRFTGEWEFRRVREYAALSRVLFGEELLLRLRDRYRDEYDRRRDYENGESYLRAYVQGWLTTLYYQNRYNTSLTEQGKIPIGELDCILVNYQG